MLQGKKCFPFSLCAQGMSMWAGTDAVWRQSEGILTKSQNTFMDGVCGQGRRSSVRWEAREMCLETRCRIKFKDVSELLLQVRIARR